MSLQQTRELRSDSRTEISRNSAELRANDALEPHDPTPSIENTLIEQQEQRRKCRHLSFARLRVSEVEFRCATKKHMNGETLREIGAAEGRSANWIREGRRVVDRRLETTDFGVTDKRLLCVESEFAQALQAASRDGSTLSALIRQAWDGGPLRVLAKNAKASCLEPHVAIIGHITIAELRSLLSSNDSVNGFANRFCWVCSARSKYLPFGGSVDEQQLELLAGRVAAAARFARSAGRMDFAPDAREAWVTVYPTLSEGHQGLLGTVTARA